MLTVGTVKRLEIIYMMLTNSYEIIIILFYFQSSSICFAKDYGKVFSISPEKLAKADVTIATKIILYNE